MIDAAVLSDLEMWFDRYLSRFASYGEHIHTNIELKKHHTSHVRIEIRDIANSLGLKREGLFLADTVALLHDIGRFDQYARHHTFDDMKSENHALLGAKILRREKALKSVGRETQKLILDVVSYHNCAELPASVKNQCAFFLRLLRDADKIDIWRVVIEHYERSRSASNSSIELNLPDRPEISTHITEKILSAHIARTKDMRTLNDFKLLQMGWVFDLNFPRTFKIAAERRYLERIKKSLPDSEIVTRVFNKVKAHLSAGCASQNSSIAG